MHLHEGPELRPHLWENREEKKKAQHLVGFEPTTLRVLLLRHVLDRRATTTAPNCLSPNTCGNNPLENFQVRAKICLRLHKSLETRPKIYEPVPVWTSLHLRGSKRHGCRSRAGRTRRGPRSIARRLGACKVARHCYRHSHSRSDQLKKLCNLGLC